MPKVAVIMGSASDYEIVSPAVKILKKFEIEPVVRIMSAHRTPALVHEFASSAMDTGIEVIIAAAGTAAHLAGVIASETPLPVIGIPVKSSTMDGLDSLLSTVQMPAGVPVATVAINGSENAGLLAVQMLSLKYPRLLKKFTLYKQELADKVIAADEALKKELD